VHSFRIAQIKCSSKEELDANLGEDISHIFDLTNDYPIRVKLYSLDNSNARPTNILSIVIHHIAFDGWSTDIFLNELKEFYRHFEAEDMGMSSELNLPPLSIQYKDFALWQKSYLTGDVLEKQLSYWKNKLESYAPLNLPQIL
jgi:hypothetical protein